MSPLRPVFAFVAVSALALACGDVADEPDEAEVGGESAISEGDLLYEGQLRGSALPDHTLHLTFDDGPGTRTTELAEYLAGQGIHATFFINGVNVGGRQRAIDTIVGRGHTLANHTQNHKLLPTLSGERVIREIADTDAIIQAAQPGGLHYLRAPYAGWTESLERTLTGSDQSAYLVPIHWDIGTRTTRASAADWDCWSKGISVERCGDLYMAEIRAKGRGIILVHDIHGRTVDMTKYIVPKLVAEGFTFASLSDVPSIQAVEAAPRTGQKGNECFSGSLVRRVTEGTCVLSTHDAKWYRCRSGEWARSSATDAACTERPAH